MDLNTLNPQQREAVTTTEGPLLILAGAGSGKTRVLTHRIAYLIEEKNVAPYRILALTFTNKAAKEMRERVDALVSTDANAIWVATFHGFCARLLSMEIDKLGYGKTFIIYDEQDQQSLIGHCIKDLNLNDKVYTKRMLAGIFSHAKNHSLSPLAFLRETGQPVQVLDAFKLYEKRLKDANALDFDDLLLCTIRLFETCPDVLEKYRERFRYILVDEYQDTNLAQYHIVNLLAKVHRNLCVVGDDDQSIYAWRGADIRNILEFEKDFEGCKVIRLEQNYRSTEKILDAANAVIHNNKGRKEKKLWTAEKGGEPIDVHEAADERDEAYYICSRIANAARLGARYDDFAVLSDPVSCIRRRIVLLPRGGQGYSRVSAADSESRGRRSVPSGGQSAAARHRRKEHRRSCQQRACARHSVHERGDRFRRSSRTHRGEVLSVPRSVSGAL